MNIIVIFATYLSQSSFYLKFKGDIRDLLTDENFKYKRYLDYLMIFLVIITVVILIYNSTNALEPYLKTIETVILYIFIGEYILRVWIYKDIHQIVLHTYRKNQFLQKKFSILYVFKKIISVKFEYMRTPLAIIDLLAILPNFRALRFLRIFLVFRLFKIFRYTKNINKFLSVIEDKKFELFTLLILFSFVIIISSVAIYMFEVKSNSGIETIFDAVYWSYVTIASLGYGDISPISSEGRVVTFFLILFGMIFISFATSIITSAFNDKIAEIKEEKLKSRIEKFKENTLIFSYNPISVKLYNQLQKIGKSAVIICESYEDSLKAQSQNIVSIYGDSDDGEFLQTVGINKNVIRVISLADSEIKNLNLILTVRSINSKVEVFSIIQNLKSKNRFTLAGATTTFYPYNLFSRMALTWIRYPNIFKAMESIIFANSNIFIDEVEVKKNLFIQNKMVQDIEFNKFKLILFGVLRDNKFIFKPNKIFTFQNSDVLIVFGDRISLNYFS